jgi:hypothetical protein
MNFNKGCLIKLMIIFFLIVFIISSTILGFSFIISIINSSAYVTPRSFSPFGGYDPGGPGFVDPSSCPLVGGVITLGSYDPTHENDRAGGHGSSYYWNEVYGGNCYHIPQESGCLYNGDSNRCSGSPVCPNYGFAADVFGGPAGTGVYLPLINGQSALWNCRYAWTTSAGSTIICESTDGNPNVRLTMTHLNTAASYPQNAPSGTRISSLFDQGNNTHMHFEAQVPVGTWVRPERYFCGGGP